MSSSKQNGLDTLEHNINKFVEESRAGREELQQAIVGVQLQTTELQEVSITMAAALKKLISIEERRA